MLNTLLIWSKNVISWTDQGQFIVNNQPVQRLTLVDLVKRVTGSHYVSDLSIPLRWTLVLKTLARLHLLLSTMPNTHVHWAIAEYKEGDGTTNDTSFTNHDISDTRKKRKAHLLGCLGLRVLSHLGHYWFWFLLYFCLSFIVFAKCFYTSKHCRFCQWKNKYIL